MGLPSCGNGVAARALEALGPLTAEQRYIDAASNTVLGTWREQQQQPLAHATLLMATYHHLKPATQVIITGSDPGEMQQWKALTSGHDRVNCYVLMPESGKPGGIPGLYEPGDRTTAYVCKGLHCLAPATSLETLKEQLT